MKITPAELVKSRGGRYASALGIDLADHDAGERFKWFLAALLYGARISETLATRTWHEFALHGVLTPDRIVDTGWDGLVRLLDAGGYVRYDYKTATKLLAVCEALRRDYGGSLDTLHEVAADPRTWKTGSRPWARESALPPSAYFCANCVASGSGPSRRCRRWQ